MDFQDNTIVVAINTGSKVAEVIYNCQEQFTKAMTVCVKTGDISSRLLSDLTSGLLNSTISMS